MKKFYSFVTCVYLFVLILFASLTYLGYLDVKLYNNIIEEDLIYKLIKFVFYYLNVYFMFIIIMRKNENKHIKYYLFYMVLITPFKIFVPYLNYINDFVMPIIFLIIISFISEFKDIKIKNLLKNIVTFVIISIIIQQLILFIRFGSFGFDAFKEFPIKSYVILNIDVLLFYFIYYKVVTINVDGFPFFHVFTNKRSVQPNFKTCEENVININIRQKIIFYIIAYGYQLITLSTILMIGKINNSFTELCIILCVFWCGRFILGKSWHSDNLIICFFSSVICFYILTLLPINLEYTLLGAVGASALFAYSLFLIAEHVEDYKRFKNFYDKINKFNIDKTTHNEIIKRCELIGLSKEDVLITVDLFVNKEKAKDLAIKYNMAVSSIRNKKSILRKKLTNIY